MQLQSDQIAKQLTYILMSDVPQLVHGALT